MADILKSLGDAMERQQQRKHENNMEVLRAIYTRPGMIVLGVILLGAALALIWPQIAPEKEVNGVVIELESGEIVFGTGDGKRFNQEMLRENESQDKEMHLLGACALGVGAAACFFRAAIPWKKKEQAETISDDSASKEAEEIPVPPKPVENSVMQSAETGSRDDRFENLKRLYEAGILSREEYDARRKKL